MRRPAILCLPVAAIAAGLGINPADAADGVFDRLLGRESEASVPQSIWRADDANAFHHQQTTLVCPEAVGPFARTGVSAIDGLGFDVACQFDYEEFGRITLYLTYVEGMPPAEYFQGSVTSAETVTEGETRLEGEAAASFSDDPNWRHALYEIPGGRRTGVWVKDFSGWGFKFRATYDERLSDAVTSALADLASRADETAATHLSACVAAEAPGRPGVAIDDTEIMNSLAASSGIMFMLSDQLAGGLEDILGGPDPASAPVWCVEDAMQFENRGYTLWRNIAGDGSRGPVDRITAATVDLSPPLEIIADERGTEIYRGQEGVAADATVYTLMYRFDSISAVFGYYSGRPDPAAVFAIADQVFIGRAGALVSHEAGTNRINLGVQGGEGAAAEP